MSEETQAPAQVPQIVYVQAKDDGAFKLTIAQLVPWVLMIALAAYFFGNSRKPDVLPGPGPAPVPVDNSVVEKLDKILDREQGAYLSAVCRNISLLIKKDGESKNRLLNNTKDIQNLVSNSGLVVTLDQGPYEGLGVILSTYFDEEHEFPQKVGELTSEARAKAVANWQKMSEDLAKVK